MKATNIAFVCYPVTSLKKARKFYEGTLGLKATKEWIKNDAFGFVEYDIGPATLAIGAGSDSFKLEKGGAAVAIEVANFEKTIKELKGMKCRFKTEPMDTPICNMAIILDQDDNKIVIHKRKRAKLVRGSIG